MACITRQREGYCGHDQCKFSDKTKMGYECIEILNGFCEVGEDCLPECPHSYRSTDMERRKLAESTFEEHYEELFSYD